MTGSAAEPGRLVRGGRGVSRAVVVWLIDSAGVWVLAAALPGFSLPHWSDALVVAAVLGVLNALVWPLLIRVVLPFTVLTLGIGAFVLNGLVALLALRLIPGVNIVGLPTAIGIAVGLSAISSATAGLLGIDEDEYFFRRAARRARRGAGPGTAVPGVVFLQIDGLGHEVLQRAIRDGNAPTLGRWLADGTHRLVQWETDWQSQTGSSQCGILHGSNDDIPAFRWYEKDTARLMVCNRPSDAAEIELRHSDGRGLLHAGGASRGNLFTGDAEDASVTMSVAGRRKGRLGAGYYGYFANPYNASRTLVGSLIDIGRELVAAASQRRRGVRPRVSRAGVYPLLRAFTTVISRDVIVGAVLEDMMAGRSVVYADFLGYDEVAHHSGIERHDTLAVLRSIDQQIGRLARAAVLAPRPYRLVVLSDHGQTQGATFSQRYGVTIEDLVRRSCDLPAMPGSSAESRTPGGEAWHASAAFADAAAGEGVVARALRRTPRDAGVPVRAAARIHSEQVAASAGLLVLASGNLGLIYCTDYRERLSLEQIQAIYPQVLPVLVEHPGIGFVLVRSEADGPVALGRHGAHYLRQGRVVGQDPLAAFGPLAAQQVLRTDGYAHVGDIMLNSLYDPQTDEVAAFEPLVGSHGGLGGPQTRAFLLFPADLPAPAGAVVGAEEVHRILRDWLIRLGHDSYAEPAAGQPDLSPASPGR